MAIPPDVRAEVEVALREFCLEHSSAATGDQLRYDFEIDQSSAVLNRLKPSFLNQAEWTSTPVARFRYSEAKRLWSLYWPEKGGKWRRLSNVSSSKDLRTLLKAILTDEAGVFWA